MKQKIQWKRPEDIVTRRTSDPREMLGKWLPKRVLKTWSEDFIDADTGEVTSIERNQIIVENGRIDQHKLQEITFAIQAGDITDVEICDDPIVPGRICNLFSPYPFILDMSNGTHQSMKVIVRGINIPHAIQIAIDYASVYLSFGGDVYVSKASPVTSEVLSDRDECIPENERMDETEEKDYFCVTVKMQWLKGDQLKVSKTDYILPANDVGEAKERISRKLDIMKSKGSYVFWDENGNAKEVTVYKAVPFAVDYIVPEEYTMMYIPKK